MAGADTATMALGSTASLTNEMDTTVCSRNSNRNFVWKRAGVSLLFSVLFGVQNETSIGVGCLHTPIV